MHVDSTGKNIAYLSKPCLSNERSGNSGGQRVYAWNVKMARNYPSPLENCLQLKTKLLMFILTIGHFFDDNIYSIVTQYYWKKKLTGTWHKLGYYLLPIEKNNNYLLVIKNPLKMRCLQVWHSCKNIILTILDLLLGESSNYCFPSAFIFAFQSNH